MAFRRVLVFDTSAAADAAADKHTPCRTAKQKKEIDPPYRFPQKDKVFLRKRSDRRKN